MSENYTTGNSARPRNNNPGKREEARDMRGTCQM